MADKVRLLPLVRVKIGAAGLSRAALLRLLAWVHVELPVRVKDFRANRAPGRPSCFIARKFLLDGTTKHFCAFIVNDQTPGELEVVNFLHQRSG